MSVIPVKRRFPRSGRLVGGFTLMELMIAVAILGIGMAMAASLFPAAVEESNQSINSSIGSIICRNGLAVAQMAYRQSDFSDDSSSTQWNKSGNNNHIDESTYSGTNTILSNNSLRYPANDANANLGFILSARQVSAGSAFYEIACVAFRKRGGGTVVWEGFQITGVNTVDGISTITVAAHHADRLRIGSPILIRENPTVAWIVSVDQDAGKAVLDRDIGTLAPLPDYGMLVQESGQNLLSPAIDMKLTMTTLEN